MSRLLDSSKAALIASASDLQSLGCYNAKGYASSWKMNLTSGLPFAEIEQDLAAGAGQELSDKLLAAHSSSALAINVFGPWRLSPAGIPGGLGSFEKLRFEAKCYSGLQGTPPHLDMLATGDEVLAV